MCGASQAGFRRLHYHSYARIIGNRRKIMDEERLPSRKRKDCHCISVPVKEWECFVLMAEKDSRTVSSYLRYLVKKERKKERGKELASVG